MKSEKTCSDLEESTTGSRKKSSSGVCSSTSDSLAMVNKNSSRGPKKFSSSFSISNLLAANTEQNRGQQETLVEKQKQASPGTKENADTVEKIERSRIEQHRTPEGKKNNTKIKSEMKQFASVAEPLSVDALSNANNSRPKSADSEFERLKDFEKTTITTNTTSNFNNLLIPVSSLPLNIIAELPESVRMSFTTAVTAATTASLTLSSEKGVNVFDETSPKKEILEGGDTLFSLDKYGQLRNGGKNGMKSNGKREGKDFTEEETEEIEVEVDCGRSDHGRLSSDEDNSNEEDLEDEEEYEEDGSGVRKKKTRTVFSRTQVGQLETMFDLKRYLSSSERSTLARDLGLSEQQIKIWFQNRRNKLKRQIKTGMEMAGSISAGTVPPPNVNAALLNSHSLYMGSMAGGASLPGAPHHHHHPHPHPSFHLGSGFSTMSPLFSTPGGHNSSTSNVGVAPNPAGTGVSLTGGPLGSASLMSNMLPGMNFHQHSGNPGIATSFQQQLNNPFFRSPLTSSFGSTTANSLLSPPGSANQNASLFSTNQNISISPFSSSTPTISANQPNASQANFSYPNLQLFKSLSGLV